MKGIKTKLQIKVCWITLLVLILGSNISFGQNKLGPKQHLSIAVKSERYGNIYGAIDHYKLYLETKTKLKGKDLYYAFNLAELYRSIRDYEHAKIWYKTVYKFGKDKYPTSIFYYAQMLKMTGEYDLSTEGFTTYRKVDKKNKVLR